MLPKPPKTGTSYGACYGAYLPGLGSADHSENTLNGIGPHLCFVQVGKPDESCLPGVVVVHVAVSDAPRILAHFTAPSKDVVRSMYSQGRFQNRLPDFDQNGCILDLWLHPLREICAVWGCCAN